MRELASLWIHRRELASLARHDLRKTYVGTTGGVAWAVLTPLIPLLAFTAVFSFGLRLPLGGAPYIFGFAAAYVPWVLLSSAIAGAAGSILEHRYLVKRVRFPVEIIPADPFLVHSLPHALLLAVTAASCFLAGYGGLPQLFLVFYFYVCAAVLALSAGLLLSSLAVVVRDVPLMLPSCLNVWFWITPIAWPGNRLPPGGRTLLALNPASYVVSGYRHAVMPAVFVSPTGFDAVAFWVVVAVMLAAGCVCFRRLRTHFWDCL
jgi:ABC-type polysaccharide/polyol phosphate export permease